jgi:hypothetical protein
MKIPMHIKINNGFFDHQFNDPIFGFIIPAYFFTKPLLQVSEIKKEFNSNQNFCEKPFNTVIVRPLPARRLMKCNRWD